MQRKNRARWFTSKENDEFACGKLHPVARFPACGNLAGAAAGRIGIGAAVTGGKSTAPRHTISQRSAEAAPATPLDPWHRGTRRPA
jgi:hypothetical protein